MSWKVMWGKVNWLGGEMNERQVVEELTEFMAYCCAEWKNMESTVAGKLVAVNFGSSSGWGCHCRCSISGSRRRKRDQEGARGGGESNTGEETAIVGNYQGDGHGGEDSVDWLGFVVPDVAEGIGIVWRGGEAGRTRFTS